jgi:hypothetical protein
VADHYFANDGTDWKSTPSPVSTKSARAAAKRVDDKAGKGDGPSATNEVKLASSFVEGSETSNG